MARTKNDQTILNSRLTELRTAADSNVQNHRKTRYGLWKLLAETYIWWRDASQNDGFLEKQLKLAGIQNTKLSGNKINFTPVIKLVWNMPHLTHAERASASNWNKALHALHENYTDNPDHYKNQTVGKLMALFEMSGGISGLVKKFSDGEFDDDEPKEVKSTKQKSTDHHINFDDLAQTAIAKLASDRFQTSKTGIGEFNSQEAVNVSDEGFTVFLARKNHEGKFTVHGSSNNADLVKSSLIHVMKFDPASVSSQLRCLIEAIRIPMFPQDALPPEKKRSDWFLKKIADKTKFNKNDLLHANNENKKQSLTSARRVHILDGCKTLSVSGSMIDSSPVITCSLNTPLFSKAPDLYMRTLDRPVIEALCYNKSAMLVDVKIENKKSSDEKFYKRIKLYNSVNDWERYIYFYKIDKSNITNSQVRFKHADFHPAWSARVGIKWFENIRQILLDPWFQGLGKHNYIIRNQNSIFEISVTIDGFFVTYSNGTVEIPFGKKCKISKNYDHVSVNSKDFAPIFFNISNSDIVGEINLSGNKHAIVIDYKTNIGALKIAIPTLNPEKNKRDTELFYMDGPR